MVGVDNSKWSSKETFQLHTVIWDEARANPTNSLTDFVQVATENGFDTNTKYIPRLFKSSRVGVSHDRQPHNGTNTVLTTLPTMPTIFSLVVAFLGAA